MKREIARALSNLTVIAPTCKNRMIMQKQQLLVHVVVLLHNADLQD